MSALLIILEVVTLVGISALCSGLNVAFMSLDMAMLKRWANLGDVFAIRMLPFRRNSHLTLAAILLSNVAAVSATSIVLSSRFYGLIAGFISTLLIVVLGEILPQALFSRHALTFCARLAPLLQLMIIVTFPISKPLQLLLDKLFPEQATRLQSRHELGMMINEHLGNSDSDLDDHEVEIVKGALQLSEKRVRDITTPLRKVYWFTPDTKVDGRKIDEIKQNGWSRIPVFNEHNTVCFGVLLMKDLVDINFDEQSYQVDDLPLYPSQVVGSMTALDTLFRKFINGGSHMIPVERDDKIIGIVTIEDLLEEIVGHEIEDETDRTKRRRGHGKFNFRRSKIR